MKSKTLDQRPWCPGGYITTTGLLLSRQHVDKVCPQDQWRAAREATAIIYRMLHS